MPFNVLRPDGYKLDTLAEVDAKVLALSVFDKTGERCTLVNLDTDESFAWPVEAKEEEAAPKKSSKKK